WRVLQLAGLKAGELHELFESMQVEDIPRESMGALHDRCHGHPLVTRAWILSVLQGESLPELLGATRFLKLSGPDDLEPLRRHLKRHIENLSPEIRAALGAAAHLREPSGADLLNVLGVPRAMRLELLTMGLLEQTPHLESRRYQVHPLVREQLGYAEIANFDLLEKLGRHLVEMASAERGLQRLTLAQEGNRMLVEGRRRHRSTAQLPDLDPLVDSVLSMLRRKKPRLDIARMQVNETLKHFGRNPEMLLADAALCVAERADVATILQCLARAAEVAPTPAGVHQEAGFHLDRGARGKAVDALERGAQTFPTCASIRRRLATIYLRQNRYQDAVDALKAGLDLEPMVPEAYGLLGEIYTSLGTEHWGDAMDALTEALRLDPDSPLHQFRQGWLLRVKGLIEAEGSEPGKEYSDQAEEWLKKAVQGDPGNGRAHAMLADHLLDREGDLDQAEWMAKRALKLGDTPDALVARARVLIRRQAFAEAEKLLNKATRKAPSYHRAFAAQGELWAAQGQVFLAFNAFTAAKERSHKDAPERVVYDVRLAQLSALIESGAAAEAMRVAKEGTAADSPADSPGPRKASSSVRRRRRRKKAAGQESQPDGAGSDGEASSEEVSAAATAEGTDEKAPETATGDEANPPEPDPESTEVSPAAGEAAPAPDA
ncbi:MAG: tetratricopeptide repeat protein, partial [Myxococcota bacterium]|nr:tetratricopeptide repeat protein [Myxococcota bacterium]